MDERIKDKINEVEHILFDLKNKLIGKTEQASYHLMLSRVCAKDALQSKKTITKFTSLLKSLKKKLKT